MCVYCISTYNTFSWKAISVILHFFYLLISKNSRHTVMIGCHFFSDLSINPLKARFLFPAVPLTGIMIKIPTFFSPVRNSIFFIPISSWLFFISKLLYWRSFSQINDTSYLFFFFFGYLIFGYWLAYYSFFILYWVVFWIILFVFY